MFRSLPVLLSIVWFLLSACTRQEEPLVLTYATMVKVPRPVAEFQLTDQSGETFTRADLLGRWTLLFSGFTHCPDVCPLTLSQIRNAEQSLKSPRHHQVVFVSVDSQRDSPEVLREYLAWFDPGWVGLTGSGAELKPLLDSLELAYVRVPLGTQGDYTMDHATAVVLIDPRGRLTGYWKAPLDARQLATDLAALPAP